MAPKPVGYATLRTTTTDGLSDYDNPNDIKYARGYDVPNMKKAHGYDVPKGSLVGNGMSTNPQTDRHMPGEVFNDIDLINLRGMLFRMSENKTNTEGCFIQCSLIIIYMTV